MTLKPYRVGQKLKLKDIRTDEGDEQRREQTLAETLAMRDELAELQARLYAEGKQSLLVVLQARDAGGKDGTIKHVFAPFNPQGVKVVSFKVPSETETKHDFLWRIHAHAPETGMIAVFNRSHYEEVLVTRVHKLIDDKEVRQRFEHIRAFESLLSGRSTRVLKIYLHISAEEQRSRLQDRLDDPHKRWKFNPSDLAERALWKDYDRVYEAALSATSTDDAPWYVIPADHKWYRDRLISELMLSTLRSMDPQYPEPDYDFTNVTVGKL